MAAPGDSERRGARLVMVGVLGALLLLPPFLPQFNRAELVLGIPILWGYVFLSWTVIVGLIAAVLGRSG